MGGFMVNYSFATFDGMRRGISEEHLNLILPYTRKDVSAMLQRDFSDIQTYWKTLTEAGQILLYHPNNIVAHEAAFVFAYFPYPAANVEKNVAIKTLRYALRFRPSVVVKHEAAEAMGEVIDIASVGAAADLAKILAFPAPHHADVVQTAEEAFGHIVKYLRAKAGMEKTIEELVRWSRGEF